MITANEPNAELEQPQSAVQLDEPPADGRCRTCDWPIDAFDHEARHRWMLYWLSLRKTVQQ